jgi:hypothetical protein
VIRVFVGGELPFRVLHISTRALASVFCTLCNVVNAEGLWWSFVVTSWFLGWMW